jgi:hypothetical protein
MHILKYKLYKFFSHLSTTYETSHLKAMALLAWIYLCLWSVKVTCSTTYQQLKVTICDFSRIQILAYVAMEA